MENLDKEELFKKVPDYVFDPNNPDGVTIVMPKQAVRGAVTCAYNTKFYLKGVELTDVVSYGIPETDSNSILCVTLKFPLTSVVYSSDPN